ncbi:hypothetical protein HMPREF0078_0691 [Anaerococcus vaginalis ATCC 51170]|uniref:Uncharacterized protein n=1 Tax=Anaerococcus vaginalis ATCC 51170 TaxID=655811 RepID=C7HTU0_9FIRM|nr:hypothetical protein HMPREF0078_0691 [Anaerococcus vaginalis ATCC 51170]
MFIFIFFCKKDISIIDRPRPFNTPKIINWSGTKKYVIKVIKIPKIEIIIPRFKFILQSRKFELIPEIIKNDMAMDNCQILFI